MRDKENIYTVDGILSKVGVSAQIDVWKKIDAVVRVKGRVITNKPYGKLCYITLGGADGSITVKCPSDVSPNINENIVFEGLLILRPGKYHTGLDLILEGSPIARVEPVKNIDKHVDIVKDSFLRLSQFVESSPLESMVVLGSRTGITDVLSQIDSDLHVHVKTMVVRVSSKDDILSKIKGAQSRFSSFAIVRGGDDDSLSVWDDRSFVKSLVEIGMPFYVALGHSHRVLQVSHYADESFSTPSAFGNALNSSVNMFHGLLDDKEHSEALIKKQSEEIAVLKSSVNSVTRPFKEWAIIAALIAFLFFK